MHATLVYVHVKPEYLQAFVDATRRNHEASVREPGNLRFDVLQQQDDPSRFVLYEAYATADAAAAHKQTAHYLAWRRTVADWMAEPRQGMVHDGLFPAGDQA
jgi:autoinducer 2-degrading protein